MPETPEVNGFVETVNNRKGVYIEEAEPEDEEDEEEAEEEEAEEAEAEELEGSEPEVELVVEKESEPTSIVAPSLDELCKFKLNHSLNELKVNLISLLSYASRSHYHPY